MLRRVVLLLIGLLVCRVGAEVYVGTAKRDITPSSLGNIWIAGYGKGRKATGVHDPIEARAIAFGTRQEQVVFIVADLVGLLNHRTEMIKDRLAARGFPREHVLVSSTHNHHGPDTIGLWGPELTKTGIYKPYLDFVVEQSAAAGLEALENLTKARVRFGQIHTRQLSPFFNGRAFGGKNPKHVLGLINDIRDPVWVDDRLLVMQFADQKGRVLATYVNWSGHPELVDSSNQLLTSDYPHYLREEVEEHFGGTAVFGAGAVGGMMSPAGSPIPLVDEQGQWVWEGEGEPRYVFNTFEAAASLGHHLAQGVQRAIQNAPWLAEAPLEVRTGHLFLPVDNPYYQLGAQYGIFEISYQDQPLACAEVCIPTSLYYLTFGPASFLSVPGEIVPELVVEPPADFDPAAPRPNKYFPQHRDEDPLSQHLSPFVVPPPLAGMMRGEFRFILGLTDNEIGYILPEGDFNRQVKALDKNKGDHYEETNSLGPRTAGLLFLAYKGLLTP